MLRTPSYHHFNSDGTTTVIRRSPHTGRINERTFRISRLQWTNWSGGQMIQDAMPNLSADDREFLLTGLTAEDWQNMMCG